MAPINGMRNLVNDPNPATLNLVVLHQTTELPPLIHHIFFPSKMAIMI